MVELASKGLYPRRFDVGVVLGLRHIQCAVCGDADLRRQDRFLPDDLGSPGVGQQQVFAQAQHLFRFLLAPGRGSLEGGVSSVQIAFSDEGGALVEGHPIRHFIRQCFHHDGDKGSKILADRFGEPAALLVNPQRQIPVV